MHLCISLWSVSGLQVLEPGMVRGDLATPGTLRDQDQILQGKTKQRGGEPADKETDRLSINMDPDSTPTAKQKKTLDKKLEISALTGYLMGLKNYCSFFSSMIMVFWFC